MNDKTDPNLTDTEEDEDAAKDGKGKNAGGGLTFKSKNNLLDHSDEVAEPYQVKNIDLRLLEDVTETIAERLERERFVTANVKKEANEVLGAILGIGQKGEDFHKRSEHEQNGLLADMRYSNSLAEITEKFMVGMEYKPPLPNIGPAGPAFAPSGPGGMGGGGGMRPTAPQPTPPGGAMPPHYAPQQNYGQPVYDPYAGQPMPPPQGYPTYPPPPYPPMQGDLQQQSGHPYQGYAQPHPYPSYPVPPYSGQYYPPQPGMPPQGAAPWPPQQHAWPPQQPNGWPPAPLVVEAEQVKDDAAKTPAGKTE